MGSPRSDKLIAASVQWQRLSCGRLIMFSRAEGQFAVASPLHRLFDQANYRPLGWLLHFDFHAAVVAWSPLV